MRVILEAGKSRLRKATLYFVIASYFIIVVGGEGSPSRACDGVHITPGHKTGQMTIMWTTALTREGSVRGHNMATGKPFILESWSFQMKENHSNSLSEYVIHRAFAMGLSPGVEYMYQPYTVEGGHVSYTFRTWPDSMDYRPEFLVYHSPHQTTLDTHHQLAQGVQRDHRFAGVLNLGKFGCDQNYEDYLKTMADMAAWIPIFTTTGKADITDNFNHYRKIFSMPGVVWPQQDLWYSFDIGRAHIISISSEVYFLSNQYLAQQQYSWLTQDLQTSNNQKERSDRPWIIVMLNQPLYCSGTPSCYANSAVLRDELEELMHTQGVDLVLTAQDNLFQRTWPVYKGKVKTESYLDPAGTVFINTGALTCDNISTSTELCRETWCAKKIPLNGAPSFGILSIHNKTHLLYEERDAASRDLLDSTWLIQHHHGPYGALTGHHPLVISVVVVLTLTIAFIAFLCVWGRKVKRYMKYQRDMAANKRNGNAFNFTSLDETELGPAEGVENDGQDRPNSQLQPIPAISEGVANGVVHSQNKHKTRTKTKNTYVALSEQPCEEC